MKKLPALLLLLALASFKASAGPYISATPMVLNSFNYTSDLGGPSASQTVLLQSAIMPLSSGTVTVTGATDYEVSLNNSSFSSTLSIPYSGDTLAPTNLYVRLKSGRSVGAYMAETISVSTLGASQTIASNGFVTSPCVVTTGLVTATSASFTWTATGAASYECTIDQSAASPAAAGTPVTTTSYSQSSLSPGTAYYFHVRGVGAPDNFTAWTNKAFSTLSTGIPNAPGNFFGVSLIPNPTCGLFTVTGTMNGTAKQTVSICVLNAVGQLIYKTSAALENGTFSKAIDLSVPAGMYLVRVGENHDCVIRRIAIAQ